MPFFCLKAFPKIHFSLWSRQEMKGGGQKENRWEDSFHKIQFLPPNNGNSTNLMMPSKSVWNWVWIPKILGQTQRRWVNGVHLIVPRCGLGRLIEAWCRRRRRGRLTCSIALSRHQSPRQFGHFIPEHGRAAGCKHSEGADHDHAGGAGGRRLKCRRIGKMRVQGHTHTPQAQGRG